MNFKTVTRINGKVYKLLEKLGLESKFPLDNIIDNNFPEVLSRLQTYSKIAKIAISGTNGKKTTTDLINHILSSAEKSYVTNVTKDAKKYPILTSIILDYSRFCDVFNGTFEKDYYTMAIDEYEISSYFNSMKFDYLVLNNLFCDQKDFCTLEEKKKKIKDALFLNSKINLIINADEPMFFKIDELKNEIGFNKKVNKFYFGFEEIKFGESALEYAQANDILRCPICNCKLDYDKRFYSHLGNYNCACGYRRPKLDVSAKARIYPNYIFLTVFYKDNKYAFRLPFGGIYNAYNALAAISTAINLGIERKVITESLNEYYSIKARDENLEYKGKNVKIKYVKNPVSLSEAVLELYGNKNVKAVFCLNDNKTDGYDTSWIWDSNLGVMKNFENRVYICGTRYDDMSLRLKYAGLNPSFMVMDNSIKNAINCCYWELEENETMLVFAVPSSIDEVYRILRK